MTGTNTVALVTDNIQNASDLLVPLVIGLTVVLLVWAFSRRVFGNLRSGF